MDILAKIDNVLNEVSVRNMYVDEKKAFKKYLLANGHDYFRMYSEPRANYIRVKYWGIQGIKKSKDLDKIKEAAASIFGDALLNISGGVKSPVPGTSAHYGLRNLNLKLRK